MKTVKIFVVAAIALLFILPGCSSPPQVKEGDTVKVHYTGTLDDGSEFDSSKGKDPLQFVVGAGQMIGGFDRGVLGMVVGEKKNITLTPDEAYGYPSEDRIMEVPKSQFPPDMELEVGMELAGPGGFPVKVQAIGDTAITIDANHPMAGKTLNFEIELVEIVAPEATEGEG
jgi:peptidylprolyl isomerase